MVGVSHEDDYLAFKDGTLRIHVDASDVRIFKHRNCVCDVAQECRPVFSGNMKCSDEIRTVRIGPAHVHQAFTFGHPHRNYIFAVLPVDFDSLPDRDKTYDLIARNWIAAFGVLMQKIFGRTEN
jgi:hypothetical protein